MAGEANGGAGGGTGQGAGTPPGGAGTPPGQQQGQAAPPTERTVREDILPAELKGRPEAEQKFILKQMVDTLRNQNEELKRLKQTKEPDKKPAGKEPDKPRGDEKPLEERILEDPEGVIAEVVQKHFGGTIQTITEDVGEVVEHQVASRFDDYDAYKDDINVILAENKAPRTKANLQMAYELAVGRKALEAKRQDRNKQLETEQPKGGDGQQQTQLQEPVGLEKEIFQASGMSLEEWNEYKHTETLSSKIKVPTGKAPAKKEG